MNYIQLFFSFMATSMILLGSLLNYFEEYLPTFFIQTFRYGKFAYDGTASKLVLEVPKSWFRHFYKLALLTQSYFFYLVTSVYVFNNRIPEWFFNLVNLLCGEARLSYTPPIKIYVAVVLITLQVYRRYYDTHYVSVFGKNSKINFSHYIVGLLHYPCLAIAIFSESPRFANSTALGTKNTLSFGDLSIVDFLAVTLFMISWYHQHKCTKILANLRKNKKDEVVSDDHKLPTGDWFDCLSSPHQTAEILMYFSVTVLLWYNITWFFVFVWVLSNQIETILLSHWWYEKTFDKFPKHRKALIPFVY